MTSVTYSSGMGEMSTGNMTGAAAKRKMIAVDKSSTMDQAQLEETRHDIEQFCRLMERGLEVDVPSTNSIRVLFMDRERTGLFLAPEHADVFKAEQAVYFGNILQFAAVAKCTHASRVAVRHKERGRAATLEFDVDTNKSRDILVEQLSKVVEVYAARKRATRVGGGSGSGLGRGQEEVTVVGALSSVISDISSSIGSMWSGGAAMDTDRPLLDSQRQANAAGGRARRSAAYRRQISNEGRELFRSSFGE